MPAALKIKRLSTDAQLPSYAHAGDAGMDIRSAAEVVVPPLARTAISTGLALELPPDTVGLVWDKSGRALKDGLKTMAGVVDAGFRGEFLVVLVNLSDAAITIHKGDKIAQLLIQPVQRAEIQEVSELSNTSRGAGGFGSTDTE